MDPLLYDHSLFFFAGETILVTGVQKVAVQCIDPKTPPAAYHTCQRHIADSMYQ